MLNIIETLDIYVYYTLRWSLLLMYNNSKRYVRFFFKRSNIIFAIRGHIYITCINVGIAYPFLVWLRLNLERIICLFWKLKSYLLGLEIIGFVNNLMWHFFWFARRSSVIRHRESVSHLSGTSDAQRRFRIQKYSCSRLRFGVKHVISFLFSSY